MSWLEIAVFFGTCSAFITLLVFFGHVVMSLHQRQQVATMRQRRLQQWRRRT